MPRTRGTTAQRGYGWAYEKRRAALPKPAGEPCPFCSHPMWEGQKLDCDHALPAHVDPSRTGPLRWAHRSCNRAHGARIRNALHRTTTPRQSPLRW